MVEFPCIICTNECELDTISCSNCKDWMHRECLGFTELELKSWSQKKFQFLCSRCCFRNGEFDDEMALSRIQVADEARRPATLLNAAKSEQKLIASYKVKIPGKTDDVIRGEMDKSSTDILELFHPAYLQQNVPLSVYGDGNCLYRAVSRSLTGTEHYHIHLRLLTALEMIMNKGCYDENSTQRLDALFSDNRVLTSGYSKLLHDAMILNSFSEMAHIYALSAALNMPIRSYYPPQLYPELSSQPFTRVVVGRGVKSTLPDVCIMWTQTLPATNINSFKPNHFVPLVKKCSDITYINLDLSSSTSTAEKDEEDHNVSIKSNSFSDIPFRNPNEPEEDSDCATGNESVELESAENQTDDNDSRQGKLTSANFMDTSEVVDLLLKSENSFEHIPGGIKENVFFIIKNERNVENRAKNVKSSFSDDCGVWNTATGASPKSYYLLSENGDLKKSMFFKGKFCTLARVKNENGIVERKYIPMDPQPSPDSIVVIHRYYISLKADNAYKKRVTWLGDGGLQSKLAIVEYVGKFPGYIPHGNAHSNSEYSRIPSYVVNDMTERLKTHKPKQVFDYLKDKYDETERPQVIQTIRDKKKNDALKGRDPQVKRKNIADHYRQLDTMVQESHEFVRAVLRIDGKSPCVILYTDEQLMDIKNLCCTGQTFVGVDKTFNLTDLHVTVMSYKQLSVNRPSTGKPPLFIGPMFIHDNSDFETYATFFLHLKLKLHDTDTSKLVIGSDDELALVKAINYAFSDSTHVLCTRHLRQNATQKLKDDAVNITDRNTILNQIFGDDGVLGADDTICFDNKCDEFEEFCSEISQNFVGYFQGRLRSQLKEKVNQPSRHGVIDDRWTNNNSESVNHMIKQAIDFRPKQLTDFVQIIHCTIRGQYKDLRSALLQCGEYRLADSHKHFQVTKADWNRKNPDQKDKLYKKFRIFVKTDPAFVISTDGQTKVVAPRTQGKKPGQRKRKINERTRTIKKKKTVD